jgi:hypothetical protein
MFHNDPSRCKFRRRGLSLIAFTAMVCCGVASQGGESGGDAGSNSQKSAKSDISAHVLNSRSFQIPYTITAAGDPNAKIELLFVSGTQAVQASNPTALPWQTAASQPSSIGSPFSFTAPQDGEYWFTTRTVTAPPAPGVQPSIGAVLKVVVDTTAPQIQLDTDADGEGLVRIDVKVDDATLVSDVQVRYVTDRIAKWIDVPKSSADSLQVRPEGEWGQIAVHVTAIDKAGNRNTTQKIVRRPRVATQPIERYAAAAVPQYDARPAPYRVGGDGPKPSIVSPPPYQVAANRLAEDLPPPATLEEISQGFEEVDQAPPVPPGLNPAQLGPNGLSSNGLNLIAPDKLPQTIPPIARDTDHRMPEDSAPGPRQRPATPAQAMKPLDQPSALAESFRDSQSPENVPAPLGSIETPDAGQPYSAKRISERALVDRVPVRYSQSERFSLEYELEAVGGQGVDSIELYGTLDEGQTWSLWGQDPDKVSPFDIEVREQGVFGYRIVVVSQNGLASPRPLSGDAPDILVVVDKEKPQVRISGAKYGAGSEIGSLVIEFECLDPNLPERPIALSFSETTDGPWTTIAGGLPNNGRYAWPADPQLPRSFYLRIDATDSAGNVASYILDQPIDAQGLAPRARIRGFRSM